MSQRYGFDNTWTFSFGSFPEVLWHWAFSIHESTVSQPNRLVQIELWSHVRQQSSSRFCYHLLKVDILPYRGKSSQGPVFANGQSSKICGLIFAKGCSRTAPPTVHKLHMFEVHGYYMYVLKKIWYAAVGKGDNYCVPLDQLNNHNCHISCQWCIHRPLELKCRPPFCGFIFRCLSISRNNHQNWT